MDQIPVQLKHRYRITNRFLSARGCLLDRPANPLQELLYIAWKPCDVLVNVWRHVFHVASSMLFSKFTLSGSWTYSSNGSRRATPKHSYNPLASTSQLPD